MFRSHCPEFAFISWGMEYPECEVRKIYFIKVIIPFFLLFFSFMIRTLNLLYYREALGLCFSGCYMGTYPQSIRASRMITSTNYWFFFVLFWSAVIWLKKHLQEDIWKERKFQEERWFSWYNCNLFSFHMCIIQFQYVYFQLRHIFCRN